MILMLQAFLIRLGQSVIEASSTLVAGIVVASVCRHVLGKEGIRQLFGDGSWSSCLRAWLLGMILPVCSLGVIPVAQELCRCRVPPSAILTFVLATPQLNPLSLLYGLTLAEPMVLAIFILCQLGLAVLGGQIWRILDERNHAWPGSAEPDCRDESGADLPLPEPGFRRLLALAITAARESTGVSMYYVGLGVLATALVASLLPWGSLSQTMRHDQIWAPWLMFGLGTMIYSGVLPGMMRITSMFDHGNSVGAAFVLFQVGIGWNVGLFMWLMRQMGWRRMSLWWLLVAACVLALAHLMERTIYFAHAEADHTHAFDDWTAPPAAGTSIEFATIARAWSERLGILEPIGLTFLALLVISGFVLRWWDKEGAWLRWLTQPSPRQASAPSIWNRPLPGWVNKGFLLALLVGLSVSGVFLYYPTSQQGFSEIARIRADAYSAIYTGNLLEAVRQLEYYDLWLRKTQIGTCLRNWHWNQEIAETTAELRQCIEHLRDLLLQHQFEEAKAYVATVEKAHRRCREAYRRAESTPSDK